MKLKVDYREYPFQDHWFKKRGSVLYYLDHGQGIPVLLPHGNPTWSYVYQRSDRGMSVYCTRLSRIRILPTSVRVSLYTPGTQFLYSGYDRCSRYKSLSHFPDAAVHRIRASHYVQEDCSECITAAVKRILKHVKTC